MLVPALDWIIRIGNSLAASTKICQKWHLFPRLQRTIHAKQTYVAAEWYNTLCRVLLLATMQLYSTCFSLGRSTLFPKYKVHSCHIPPRCRFCHSRQLSQHPIWQYWLVRSWTIGRSLAHTLHRCSDEQSHPNHLRFK